MNHNDESHKQKIAGKNIKAKKNNKKPISMPKGDLQCVVNDGSLLEYVVHTH